jgi:hypothetical protein
LRSILLIGEDRIDVVSFHCIHAIGRGQHEDDEDDDPNFDPSDFSSEDENDDG